MMNELPRPVNRLSAESAVAAGLDVVALGAEVFAASALQIDGFTCRARPGCSHHERILFTCGLCIVGVLARLIHDRGAAHESLPPWRYSVDLDFETET